jgi:hypothetical protein
MDDLRIGMVGHDIAVSTVTVPRAVAHDALTAPSLAWQTPGQNALLPSRP